MKRFKKSLGERIRERRQEKGFKNQIDLAIEVGVDQTRISRWETGSEMPMGENQRSLMTALDLPETFFDTPETEPIPNLTPFEQAMVDRVEKVERALTNFGSGHVVSIGPWVYTPQLVEDMTSEQIKDVQMTNRAMAKQGVADAELQKVYGPKTSMELAPEEVKLVSFYRKLPISTKANNPRMTVLKFVQRLLATKPTSLTDSP